MSPPVNPRPKGALPMKWVIALTIVVTGFAAVVALWMYWVAGALVPSA